VLNAVLRVAPFIVVLAVIALRVRMGAIRRADIGWQRPRSIPAAAGWWLLFLVIAAAFELLLYRHGALELGGFKHSGFDAALRVVGMILLAPIAEELLFRGLILNFLVKKLPSPHLAVAIQAAFFVALHAFAYSGTFAGNVGIVQSFVDASLFAYARRNTDSIFTSIAMHMTGNAIAVIEMLA
jgi:membrane protease YdiL (CAAX protease family)